MKETIEQIDKLLARLQVSGDSVLYLAEARKALGGLYQQVQRPTEQEGNRGG